MGLNEAMEQAALAWLREQVKDVANQVGQPLAADLVIWLSKMPKYDRHEADVPEVDDGQQWRTNATQPRPGAEIEIKHSDGALWRGFWDSRWSVDFQSVWRYI